MKKLEAIRLIAESFKSGRAVDGVNDKKLIAAAEKFVATEERFFKNVVRKPAFGFAASAVR